MTPSEKPNDANAATAVVVVVSIVAGDGPCEPAAPVQAVSRREDAAAIPPPSSRRDRPRRPREARGG